MSNKNNNSTTRKVNVLSLFDGMACGMLAFLGLGVSVENYYAYEIDKYAIKTTTKNFPQIQHFGDVFKADFSGYEDIDFLVGGSPCTFWSIAQSTDKRETTASGLGWELFCQYLRAVREVKPKYFLYENNKSISKDIYNSISQSFGFEPIMINAALVSAQNRQRYYWVGKRNADGSYSKVDIPQPNDRGILLKDILDGNDLTNNDKSWTLTASYNGAVAWNTIERHQRNMVVEQVNTPKQVGAMPRPNGELSKSQAFRVYSTEGKSVNLTANGGGAGGKTGLYAIPIEFENDIPTKAISGVDGKTYIVHEVKDGKIKIKDKLYPIKLQDGYYIIRKLTIKECMRLQTVPEWFDFSVVSDNQAYKMLGNGWCVEVIKHLLSYCINEKEEKQCI